MIQHSHQPRHRRRRPGVWAGVRAVAALLWSAVVDLWFALTGTRHMARRLRDAGEVIGETYRARTYPIVDAEVIGEGDR